jgi:hypothetical protein
MYLYRNFIFMENQLVLNVKTVPAWDYDMMCPHTAYTISAVVDGKLTFASGWTLKDAIELYSSIYHCNKEILKILRPFKRQLLKPFPIPPL